MVIVIEEFRVQVVPPFWQQTWFVVLMIVLGLAVLYLLITWRIRVARKKEMEKTQVEKLKADD